LDPYLYLKGYPGKDIRSAMIDAFDSWLKVDAQVLNTIKNIIEMLHTASLLVDDVEDASCIRRGVPTAHTIYGIPITINCANYVYFLALREILQLKSHEAVYIFTREMLRLHQGQGMELYFREHALCPTMHDYEEMIKNSKFQKTISELV
jgi:geranylgeranyl diphosphate synthase type 3